MATEARSMLRNRWEARAQRYPDQLRGVLFQGLPEALNQAIHRWHAGLVSDYVAARLPTSARVVDLAAGYGRLSRYLQEQRPDLWVTGADLSFTYAERYSQAVAPALCTDLTQLPYTPATWDAVLLVTGLMYLTEQEQTAAMNQVLPTLKPGGLLLCVDPGAELTEWLRWFQPRLRKRTTGGDGFACAAYRQLFNRSDCVLIASGGNGWFTLALPLLWLMNATAPTSAAWLADWVVALDRHQQWFARWVLHRWVVVQKR